MNHRLAVAKLPTARAVERTSTPRERSERGIARGVNAKGDVVVFDVARGTITRNDDAPITLAGAQDPSAPGLVGVDDDGKRALVLCARAEHGDPSLVLVDLDARATDTARSFEGPGWLCGGFAGKQIVVCEQRLGERAKFSVLINGKTVWSIDGMQQPCVPVRVRDDVVALLACPAPDAVTGTGPTSLIALDLASGATVVLAAAQGKRVRLHEGALVVDGGTETVRVTLS